MLLGVAAIALVATGILIARAMAPVASTPTFEARTWDEEWIANARFGPDGQTIVFSSARAGNVPRVYVIRAGGILSQPVGDPATQLLSVSSTGELAVLTGAHLTHHALFTGTLSRMALDGAPVPVKGLQPQDNPFALDRDGGIVVQAGQDVPSRIERVNPTTGARAWLKLLAPSDSAGVNIIRMTQWLDGGKGYAYDYGRQLSRLYVISGVK